MVSCSRKILFLSIKKLTNCPQIIFSTMLAATSWKTFLDYRKIQNFSLDLPVPDAVKCKIAFLTIDNEARMALLVLYVMVFSGEACESRWHTKSENNRIIDVLQ